ncbi:MAG: hypothetical protein UY52_C0009G0035 [Parcubacteria group bacterium GW2011_GWC2_49_9]|nr:MAG: hypothetical protein UY34_C0011G0020 [Parcubacteria group bacterium GW2011_GWA2_48_9]KKW16175.1 MAG: hypothetical protein UY52_C0009G0035 [Parcubacteria group bacterium GW2011_GWC2_49_9]
MENDPAEILKKKRIFVSTKSAGAPGIYAFTRVLRRQGIQIDFWNLSANKYNFNFDLTLPRTKLKIVNLIIRLMYFFYCILHYDIFHFYSMSCFFNSKFELLLLNKCNKYVINTFAGSEAFDIQRSVLEDKQLSAYYEYARSKPQSYFVNHKKNVEFTIKHSKEIAINGPWLIDSISRFDAIIPYSRPIPESKTVASNKSRENFIILHAPTNQGIKGTKYIVNTIKHLKAQGLKIELLLPDQISHEALLALIQEADIVIDQILMGWYGGFAVEVMARGKPVIAYLKTSYRQAVDFGNTIPIINASVRTLGDVLTHFYYHQDELHELSEPGREFVKKIHAPEVIAAQYAKLYEKALIYGK